MTDPNTTQSALSIQELRFRYPDMLASDWVVDIASLELRPGEQLLLKGGSGTGKSTLLQLIAGLLRPNHGSITIGGTDITALSGAKADLFRGRQIGFIFQTFNLLHGFTAIENVMAALMFSDIPSKQHRQLAASTLTALGLNRHDADVAQLSVGQQQRVAVARAVVCEPALVLADEPTASLDPENADTAMDLIQQACADRNAALLCVSHDRSLDTRFARSAEFAQLRSVTKEVV
jgi:ABC-type lipoprotein export system ATPase subunit